jgi:hypothetical protein
LQSNFNPFVTGEVDTFNSGHSCLLPLSLFVLWVFADDVQPAVALDNLALGTAFPNGW